MLRDMMLQPHPTEMFLYAGLQVLQHHLFTEDFVGVAKSTDGGVTFTANENAYDVNGKHEGFI